MDQHGLTIICIQVLSHIALIGTFRCFLYHDYHLFAHLGYEIGGGVDIMLLSFERSLNLKLNEPRFSSSSQRLNLSKSCNTELSSVPQMYLSY